MMRIKKYFSFLLSIAITLSFNLYPMQAIAENLSEVYKAYNLSIFSNTCDITSSEVLESNGKFYMNIEDIAKLARFELTTESDNSQNTFILRQGVRKICIQKETGDLLDYIRYVHVTGGNEHRINQITIPYLLIESKYYYECIPLLTYLGAECKTSELGGLIVTMPAYTLWETIVPDMEKYWRDTNINNQSVEEKQWTIRIDVANELLGDIWSIPEKWGDTYKTGEYLEQALYEIFDVNVMSFDSVQKLIGEENKATNDNVETLLTSLELTNDSLNSTADLSEKLISDIFVDTDFIPQESSGAFREALGKTALNFEFSYLLATIDSYNTIEHRLNYDEHTKNCFTNILNDDVLEYITSLVFDKEEFEAYKNEIKKNENESDFIKKFLNNPIKSKLEEKYGIPKWLPDGYIEFIEFSNIEYSIDWKTEALDISKTLKDSEKLAEDVLRDKHMKATNETIMELGSEKALAKLVGGVPASFGMLSYSLMTDVALKDSFDASKSSIYSYCLSDMQYDILEPLTFVSMDTVMDNNCSDPNKLEIMRDMIALYYRITIAFCQNNAKALEEFHVGKSEREQLVSYYNQLAEGLAVYLYMITNCTVSEIPDYDDIDDSVLNEEWMESLTTDDSIELYSDVLDFFYNNISTNWKDFNSDYFDPENRRFPDDYISYMWWHYESERSLDKTYYSFIDLDNDGFDELLVGTVNGEHGDSIFDIFTYIDGKPVHLVTSAERDWYFLGKENVIGESGSGGAALSSTTYYRLENGKLQPIEKYIYDGYDTPDSPYYYADEFEYIKSEYEDYWYYSDKNRKNITEEEFYARNKYDSDSKTIPDKFLFSEYTPSSDESSIDITGTVVDLGNCGKNVTWVLHNDGTLMISGRGEMDNFSSSQLPWAKEKNKSFIKKVIIENGVTSIGDDAFSGCETLTNVIIPDSITSIGKNVFSNCTSLTSISIPNSVNKIGESTFSQCCSLISVTIPEGVTNIDESLFGGCTSIESIIIPNTVSNIGNRAFSNCESLKSIILPNNLTKIGDNVFFGCKKITQIKIPKNVKNIGQEVFANCLELESIIVDDENKCYCSCEGVLLLKNKIKLIAYPAAKKETIYSIPNEVIYIDDYAFSDCQMLTSIILPDGLTIIGNWAFCECKSLSSITIPDGLTTIGRWAFSECKSLSSITIPYSVTNIGNCAFFGCDNLNDVYYPGTEEEWISINNK